MPASPLRRWMAGLRTTVVAAPLLAVAARPAPIHLHLVQSNPAAGTTLDRSPQEIRLAFSGPVMLASVTLRDAGGQRAALGRVRLSVDSLLTIGHGRDSVIRNAGVVAAPIQQALKPGRYQLIWKATGSDGHAVKNQFVFTLSAATPAPAPGTRGTNSTPPRSQPRPKAQATH